MIGNWASATEQYPLDRKTPLLRRRMTDFALLGDGTKWPD
jgi:hypothetical protein